MNVEVTRTYLQIETLRDLIPSTLNDPSVRIVQVNSCAPSFYRYLYVEVGRYYHWTDKLSWTDERIRQQLNRPEITLWVMYADGAPAGYFELERYPDGSTEVAYFGLLPEFLGRGLGKYLLTTAVQQAFKDGAQRVWLHTCTLDDAAALPNYLKRGFKPFKQEKYFTEIAADEEIRAPGFSGGNTGASL